MSTWGRRGLSRAVRTRILARDGGVCQLGYPGCTFQATEIDDIIPVSALGGVPREQLTDDNRRAVCSSCHKIRSEQQKLAAIKVSTARRNARRHLPVPRKHPGDW